MPIRRLAIFAVLALAAMPSPALAQSAGDQQYTDPVPETPQASPDGAGAGGNRVGGSGGSGSGSETPSSAGTSAASDGSASAPSRGSGSGSSRHDSDGSLPQTGFPVGILVLTGFILGGSGRALKRLAKEPAPDPYAGRDPDVPSDSPMARAKRIWRD